MKDLVRREKGAKSEVEMFDRKKGRKLPGRFAEIYDPPIPVSLAHSFPRGQARQIKEWIFFEVAKSAHTRRGHKIELRCLMAVRSRTRLNLRISRGVAKESDIAEKDEEVSVQCHLQRDLRPIKMFM